MTEDLEQLKQRIEDFEINTKEALEDFRLQFISKKGQLAPLFGKLKSAPAEQRKALGQGINQLKQSAETKFKAVKVALEEAALEESAQNATDLTLPTQSFNAGSIHPLNAIQSEIEGIFERIGFSKTYGPEIEDDHHNFTALNFPPNHPAREMQDTYFLDEGKKHLLRTHTSSVQVRLMETEKPPIRAIMPGRVYRNEAISARAHCLFHQIEGLYINEKVSFKELKQTLLYFAKEFFGADTKIRLRPSYFPFTEPSAEIDISCFICGGKGCKICKYSGWVEIGGAGMVDPNVLEACGIDSNKFTGFAFGMGVERMAMLKYQLDDIRLFTENDVRFLRQF